MMLRKYAAPVIVLAVIALIAAAGWYFMSRPAPVTVLRIEPASTEIALSVVGRVRPGDLVQVTSLNPGQVIQLMADDGDVVAAGAPLAIIRATVEQAQTQASVARERAARAEAVAARRTYDRTLMLHNKGFAAPAALDQAEAALKASEANVDAAVAEVRAAAERTLEYTVRAPMSGTILVRPIDSGQVVAAGETLFEMGSDTGTEIWADVDETYADGIQPGQKARAALSGSERIFTATVQEVSPRVDPASGGRQIKLLPDSPDGLPPGRSIDVTVVISERPGAIVIPRKAVIDATADAKVYVVDVNNVVQIRPVALLRWPSVNAIVERGLQAGDLVVLDPATVQTEQKVRPIKAGGS